MPKVNLNPILIRRVSIADTLLAIPPGTGAYYSCTDLGKYNTVNAGCCRLNKVVGRHEWSISTDDNGSHYTVMRMSHPEVDVSDTDAETPADTL